MPNERGRKLAMSIGGKQYIKQALARAHREMPAANELQVARQCADKRSYNKAGAIKASVAMSVKKGEQFTAYECVFCKQWHTGHTQKGW